MSLRVPFALADLLPVSGVDREPVGAVEVEHEGIATGDRKRRRGYRRQRHRRVAADRIDIACTDSPGAKLVTSERDLEACETAENVLTGKLSHLLDWRCGAIARGAHRRLLGHGAQDRVPHKLRRGDSELER